MIELLEMGVDGLITNRPDLAREVVDSREIAGDGVAAEEG